MPFDPDKHQMLPTRHFDDFQMGERFFAPSRTMGEGVLRRFRRQVATTIRSIMIAPI